MRELSVFVDESGDFGETRERPSYYLVTMLYHDQSHNISKKICKLTESIRKAEYNIEYIHTAPIIRREGIFSKYSINDRRKLIYKMLNFFNICKVSYNTIVIDRKDAVNKIQLSAKLIKSISKVIEEHHQFFSQYDNIIVYYDNGQNELRSILSRGL